MGMTPAAKATNLDVMSVLRISSQRLKRELSGQALTEDPGAIFSTHMTVHNHLQVQGIRCLLLASMGTRDTHGAKYSHFFFF